MDEYLQPRPVLYGTWEDEAPPQTQTRPGRSGPPRYPPAPPMAGDAPDPWEPSRSGGRARGPALGTMSRPNIWLAPYLAILFAASLGFTLVQVYLGIDRGLLMAEVLLGMIIVPSLWWLNSRSYFVALRLLAIAIILGIISAQWLSPLLWASVITAIYLLRPSLRDYYRHMAEIDSIKKSERVVRARTSVWSTFLALSTFLSRRRKKYASRNSEWRRYLNRNLN